MSRKGFTGKLTKLWPILVDHYTLGDRATAWVESEVDEWLKVQKVERSLLKTMECTEELLNKVFCSA